MGLVVIFDASNERGIRNEGASADGGRV